MKRIFWCVYAPDGTKVRTFATRMEAKKFLNKMNEGIPSWHYDELWKMGAEIR